MFSSGVKVSLSGFSTSFILADTDRLFSLFFLFTSIYLFYIYIVLQDLKMRMLFVELNIRLQE